MQTADQTVLRDAIRQLRAAVTALDKAVKEQQNGGSSANCRKYYSEALANIHAAEARIPQ